MTDVFISHSSKDHLYAEELVRFLCEVIDFDPGGVICTSALGHDLDFGTQFEKQLHEAIEASEVMVPLISRNSLASLFCAFEMGAAWGLSTPLKPILLPGFPSTKLGRPLSSFHHHEWRRELGWIRIAREIARATRNKVKVPPERVAQLAHNLSRYRAS